MSIDRPRHKSMDFSKPASFNLPLKPIMIAERGTARFTCSVGGTPEPEIEWSKGISIVVTKTFCLNK